MAQFECTLRNAESVGVAGILLLCLGLRPIQAWNIDPSSCSLPNYISTIPAASSTTFGFIQPASLSPRFTIVSYRSVTSLPAHCHCADCIF